MQFITFMLKFCNCKAAGLLQWHEKNLNGNKRETTTTKNQFNKKPSTILCIWASMAQPMDPLLLLNMLGVFFVCFVLVFFASYKKNFNVEGGQHFNCLPRTYLNTYLPHSSVFLVFLYNRLHCMLQNIPVWEQHIFWSTTKENSKNKLEHLEKQHLQKGIYVC